MKLRFLGAEEFRDSYTTAQLKEIKKLYEDWSDEIGQMAEDFSKGSNFSSALRATQYTILRQQLRDTAKQIGKEIEGKARQNIYSVSQSVTKDNIKFLTRLGFDGAAASAAMSSVPDMIVRNLVTGKIYDTGWSLSKAIWGNDERTLKDIYGIVAKGFAQNMDAYEIAKLLESYVDPSKRKPWNLTMPDGKRIYKKQVDYSAQRLVRTLAQHAFQQSLVATTINNPFVEEYIWIANGSRPCPLCLDRDGTHYKKDELPLDHPNGGCTFELVVRDNYEFDLAKWVSEPEGTYPDIDKFAKEFM